MAFDVLDEHEQGELVRKWLRENALAILVGIVAGLVLIFGWQQWKARNVQRTAEAAARFQALVDAEAAGKSQDAAQIAEALRSDYGKSVYAVLAALHQAQAAIAANDLPAAASALEWAGRNAPKEAALRSLIALRTARVKLAQGDAEAALRLADGEVGKDYAALAAELRGDALLKLGRTQEASAAYDNALAELDPQAPGRAIVQMKRDDLTVSGGAPVAADAPATAKAGS